MKNREIHNSTTHGFNATMAVTKKYYAGAGSGKNFIKKKCIMKKAKHGINHMQTQMDSLFTKRISNSTLHVLLSLW